MVFGIIFFYPLLWLLCIRQLKAQPVNELEKPIPITHQSQLLNNPYLGLPLQVGSCQSCGSNAIEECEGMLVSRNLFCAILHWTITFRFPNGCKWKQVLWSYSLFILHGMMSENLFLEKKKKRYCKEQFQRQCSLFTLLCTFDGNKIHFLMIDSKVTSDSLSCPCPSSTRAMSPSWARYST